MAFVNEFVSPEDFEKYGFKELNKKYRMWDEETNWTIDKERDIYIRRLRWRMPPGALVDFQIRWGGELFEFTLKNLGNRNFTLEEIKIPHSILIHKDKIIADIKQALLVHGYGGVYNTGNDKYINLDF